MWRPFKMICYDELQETLCKILEKAKENQIKFNPQKCLLFVKEVTFLGHIINEKGICIDQEKVKAMTELEPPKDKKIIATNTPKV